MSKKRRDFTKNTVMLIGSNLTAQIITVLFIPIITRMYAPGEFGNFALLVSLTTPIIAISNLRYAAAIMLTRTEQESNAAGLLCFLINAAVSLLTLILVYVLGEEISLLVGLHPDSAILYFAPIIVFILGMGRFLKTWVQRYKKFKQIAYSVVGSATTDRAVTIVLGFIGYSTAVGLLIGRVCGGLIVVSILMPAFFRNCVGKISNLRTTLGYIPSVMKRYAGFPKYSWVSLLQQLSLVSPALLLGGYFSPEIVGFYMLAYRVLIEPTVIVGEAIARTFYEQAAADFRAGRPIGPLVIKLVDYLLQLFVVPILIVTLVAPDLFQLVFGEEWRRAGELMQFMLPMFLVHFLVQPLMVLFNVLERHREWSAFAFLNFITTLCTLTAGGVMQSETLAILMYSCVSATVLLLQIFWLAAKVSVRGADLLVVFVRPIRYALISTIPIVAIKWAEIDFILIEAGALTITAYAMFIVYKDPILKEKLRKMIFGNGR